MRLRRTPALVLGCLLLAPALCDARKCPNVLFVTDRSGSMGSDPMGGGQHPTKWELLRMGIIAALGKYGDRLAFGLEMFTSGAGNNNSCYTDTRIDVQVAHGTAAQITTILNNSSPSSSTNTGEAIKRAYTDGALHDATRGNFIILITDGDPNCNTGDSGQATYTISEIANAAAQNPSVHTFVVGFDGSGGVNPANLNKMAVAGKEPIANCNPNVPGMPCYYSASTTQQFLAAMDHIVGTLAGGSVIGGCDDSCFSGGCPNGQVCGIPKGQTAPSCFVDPCAAVTCMQGSYCKNGVCQATCPTCAQGQKCVGGVCTNDPCAVVQCAANQACDPTSGRCVVDQCAGGNVACPLPLFCDPLSGTCIDDPCRLVECPANATCYGGYCMDDPPPAEPADMSMAPEVTDDGGFIFNVGDAGAGTGSSDAGGTHKPAKTVGCAIGVLGRGGAGGSSSLLLLGGAALGLLGRRRRRMRA